MSRAAETEVPFAGEMRLFRMRIGAQRAVQEKCDAGPMELLRRFGDGTWRVDDLREPIYQGLVDGGMDQAKATQLLVSNFDDKPKMQFVPIARAVVAIGLVGVEDEDLGENAGEGSENHLSPDTSSGSPTSTD